MMAVSAKAQIFIQEGDNSNRADAEPGLGIDLPGFGEGTDSYTPVGTGILLFAAMGGAYLLKKKKVNK